MDQVDEQRRQQPEAGEEHQQADDHEHLVQLLAPVEPLADLRQRDFSRGSHQ
jgi:hypothetical protein